MIKDLIRNVFISIAIGYLAKTASDALNIEFINRFLNDNLVTILIALLAINAATMGIVLSKIRELIDASPKLDFEPFKRTKSEMLLSVQEQVILIVLSVVVLSAMSSQKVAGIDGAFAFLEVMAIAIFVHAIMILYDTAKSVFIIMDFGRNH